MRRSKRLLVARRRLRDLETMTRKHSCKGLGCEACPVEVLRQEDWMLYVDMCSVLLHQNRHPGPVDRTEKVLCRLKEKLEDELASAELEEGMWRR